MNQTDTRPSRLPSVTPSEPPAPSAPPTPPEKEPLLGLSAAQVAGSAAAAATAAALGSRLGVVGTVVGAALISAITAVAGAFYTQSLRRTRAAMARTAERMPTVTLRVPSQGADIEVTGGLPLVPDQPEGTAEDVAPARTGELTPADDTAPQPPWWRRLTWKSTAVTAAVVFALSAVLVTGIELVTDRSLDGTGRTSVGHLFGDDSSQSSDQQTETPTPSPSDGATDGSTTEETGTATPSESPTESATPSDGATPTDEPSATPTDTATDTPSGSATAVPTR